MEPSSYKTTFTNEKNYWWYKARAEILEKIYQKYIQKRVPKNNRILNIGCGTGILSELFQKYGAVFSLDFSHDALVFSANRDLNKLVQADVQNLPIKKNAFDTVFCFDIIEHVENDLQALKAIENSLNENGFLLLTVPANKFLWSSFDELNWHKRRYIRRELKDLFNTTNLEILKLSYFNSILFPVAFLRRIYEKLFKRKADQYYLPKTGKLPNYLFYKIFSLEGGLLKLLNFPFGVSLIAVLQKRTNPN